MLVAVARELAARGQRVRGVHATRDVLAVLTIAGFDQVVDIVV